MAQCQSRLPEHLATFLWPKAMPGDPILGSDVIDDVMGRVIDVFNDMQMSLIDVDDQANDVIGGVSMPIVDVD